MNKYFLIGRITAIETNEEINKTKIILANIRSYKNPEGIYETDFIPCSILSEAIAHTTKEYCGIGDLVGVSGRIETNEGTIELIVEKISFLTNKTDEIEREEDGE